MTTARSAVGGALVAGLAVALTACGSGPSTPNAEIAGRPATGALRVATGPTLAGGPLIVAQRKRYFQREGFESAEVRVYRAAAAVAGALQIGNADAAVLPAHTAIQLGARGAKVKVIMHLADDGGATAILAPAGIGDIAELKGKRIAYEEGSTGDLLLRASLRRAGLSIADIRKVPTLAQRAVAAVAAGEADVAVTTEPHVAAGLAGTTQLRVLVDGADEPSLLGSALVVREDVLLSDPGKVAAMVRAWKTGAQEYQVDTEESRAAINLALGVSADAEAYRRVGILSYADNIEGLEEFEESLGEVERIARREGIVEGPATEDELVNESFVEGGHA